MAMRVGEMMVIVRAQDFASRTLRRVGNEFSHLSRDQQLAYRKMQLAWQKYDAQASRLSANESMRQLNMAKTYRRANADLARMVDERAAMEQKLLRAQALQGRAFDAARARGGGRINMADPSYLRAARMAKLYQGAIDNLADSQTRLETKQGRLFNAIQQYPTWVRRARDSTIGYAEGVSRVSQEYQKAWRNLATWQQNQLAFNQALARMPINRMQEMGAALGGIGRTMQLFGAVSTVALGAAANSAAQFNTEISLAATQARDLDAPVSQVATRIDQLTNGFTKAGEPIEGVLDLMERYPAAQSDMAAASFDIFSSMNLMNNGITDVTAGLDLLETANKIAVAGGEDLATATNAMITVFNNFDPQLQNTTETLDTMFDIIRFGRMRLGDFNTMMNKVAPAAAGANLSLRDVGGAMAFLTEVMPSQRMVATGISRLIDALNHPDIRKGLRMMGVEVQKVGGGLRPLDEIMQDLAERFPKLAEGTQTAAEFFKEVSALGRGGGRGVMFTMEGRKALTQMITHLDQYLDRQRQIDQNTDEFAAATTAQMQSLGVQWQIFLNRVRAIVIAIGTDAIPVFADLGAMLKRVLDAWQSLNPETRETIVRMAVLASVATLVGGAFLALVGAGLGMAAMFRRLLMNFGDVATRGGKVAMLFGRMVTALRFLGTLAAISIVIDVKRTGDVTGWKLLMGMLAGAAAGSRFGPIGALAGGIVVPVSMVLMSKDPLDQAKEQGQLLPEAYQREFKKMVDQGVDMKVAARKTRESWLAEIKKFKLPDAVEARERNRANVSAEMNKSTASTKRSTQAQRDYNAAMEVYQKKMTKYAEAQKQYRTDMEHHKRAVEEYNQNLAKETVRATSEAVDGLRSMYLEIEKVNEGLMGELFQGPLLGGESFDLAKEWGITASIESMITDIKQANSLFNQIQSGFMKLRKIGIAPEMIAEIQKMAPKDALGFIQGILKGTPKQQQELIKAFNQRNKNVQDQTKMDFVDEIERFRKAGVNMGDAIKNGFQSAQVGAWFDSWVQRTFPNVISSAVNQAVTEWQTLNPMPTAPKMPRAPIRPTAPPAATTVNDNSETNIYINMGDSGRTATEKRDEERRVGFIVRQATQGRGRVIGRPTGLDPTTGRRK